jgi:hypothetical protein
MAIRNLAVTAMLVPALMLTGCGHDDTANVSPSTGAKTVARSGVDGEQLAAATDGSALPDSANPDDQAGTHSDDPVINAYYLYRAALDLMMRSGGRSTKQLAPVMTPELFRSINQQAKYYRAKRLHNTGATKVIWARRALLANGVIVRACYDTQLARTVDAAGRSVLAPKTPTRWLDEMRVEQVQGGWVVDGGRTYPAQC